MFQANRSREMMLDSSVLAYICIPEFELTAFVHSTSLPAKKVADTLHTWYIHHLNTRGTFIIQTLVVQF